MSPFRFLPTQWGIAAFLVAAIGGCYCIPCSEADFAAIPCITPLDFDPAAPQAATNPVASELAGPHPVEAYVAVALQQNPRVHAARKTVVAKANRVPQAGSLEDPMVSVMGYPFTDLAPQFVNGRMTGGIGVSQKVPWNGKLDAQAEAAESEANQARAQLAAAELEVVEKVRRAYHELHYAEEAVKITERDKAFLVTLAKLAEDRYKVNAASQQDILRAQVEVSSLDADLIRMKQDREMARVSLARLLHTSPETQLETQADASIQQIPSDIERLYRDAIAHRPELHAQLAMIQQGQWMTESARLNYLPDVTYNVDWEEMSRHNAMSSQADGIDMVRVGLMFNVPIYRKRLDAAVREAEAKVVASAREYDAMKDETQEEVKNLMLQVESQWQLSKLFRDSIVPKADQTLQISLRAYQVGQVDVLQLVDNWRQLLKMRLAQVRAETQLRQSLASLERLVGGQLEQSISPEPIPAPEPRPADDAREHLKSSRPR